MLPQPRFQSQQCYVGTRYGQVYTQKLFTSDNLLKPVLICVHGGPGWTHNQIKCGLEELAQLCPVVFYDQLGGGESSKQSSGQSSKEQVYSIGYFLEELTAVVRHHTADFARKFVLLGVSWGGVLLLEYYLKARGKSDEQPLALIFSSPLISTKLWIEDANTLRSQLPSHIALTITRCQQQGRTSTEQYRKASDYYNSLHVFRKQFATPHKQQAINKSVATANMEAYLYMWGPSEFYCTGTLSTYDGLGALKLITVPTLFLCGQFDEARPATLQKFKQQVEGSEIRVLQGCSHLCYLEKQAQFRQIVSEFYTKLSTSKSLTTQLEQE